MIPHRLRLGRVAVRFAAVVLLGLASPCAFSQDISPTSGLDSEVASRLTSLTEAVDAAVKADRFNEALAPARRRVEIVAEAVGADDWRTGDLRREADQIEDLAGRPKDVRDRFQRAVNQKDEIIAMHARRDFAAAIKLQEERLATLREILGENDYRVAAAHADLGVLLSDAGKPQQAEPALRRGLEASIRNLGAKHPFVATCYRNLAENRKGLGALEEAEDLARKSMTTFAEILGERHAMTLQSRSTVLSTLFSQRKLAEAEALGRRALAAVAEASDREVVLAKAELEHNLAVIVGRRSNLKDAEAFARSSLTARKALLGEDHYETLISATNLASFLLEEAKYGEAEEIARATLEATSRRYGEESPEVADALEALSRIVRAAGRMTEAETLARRALAMFIRTIGPDFPATATAYNNLSLVFMTQGRYAEAEELLRRALEVRRKTQGEDHFETVSVRDNLAVALDELHRPAEAEPLHRAALEYRLKKFGRDDAATASAYNNLGLCLVDQGKLDEAESALREHLEILKRVLPPGHPTLARGYSNLMRVYQYRKQWDVAVGLIREAAQVRGAALGDAHPLTARTYDILASILAQGGAHEEALAVWEKAAASESVSGAFGRKGLRGAVEAARSPSVALAAALARAGRPIEAWDRWEAGLARGLLAEVAGRAARPLTPEEQREEAELAALSQANEEAIGRLALLRTPTPADAKRLETLRAEGHDLLRRSLELEQRFEARYGALAGQPASLEVARASLAEGEAFVGWSDVEPYHYACLLRREGEPEWIPLSGSGPDGAWTPEDSNTTGRLRRALATREASTGEVQAATNAMAKLRISPLLPRLKGVRRLVVVNSPALSGLPVEPLLAASGPKEEAIAVSYAPSASMFVYLKGLPPRADGEPKLLAVGDPAYSVPAEITYAPNLALNGPKHAAVDGDAEARSREADRVLRGGPAPPARLPGTRREVEAIAGLFPPGRATTLLGEHARESALQGLARSGELKDFRFIHFAGHGRSDPGRAFASALLLAPDPDQPGEASADSDGIVTAEQIARGWDLDADLVVLSACESALGLDAAGEGQLGFAQPLFAKGARSLVLSLWKVDDDATALLMARFYRNLLGEPAAKLAPMPKAEALADAKAWLREAADDEIGRAVAALPRGPIVTLDIAPASNAGRRYADPRYWAAFVLIGSPD